MTEEPDGGGTPTDAAAPAHNNGGVLISFAPWIAVWILTSNSSWIPGLAVASVVSLGLIAFTFWEGRKPKILDWGTLVVMLALTAFAVVADESWLGTWLNVVLNGALFLLVVGTIVIGRPFTVEYAKESTPPEVWDTPAFRSINLTITAVWALALLAMTVGATVDALYTSGAVAASHSTVKSVETWANWGVTIIALVVAMKFGAWYPDAYMARQERLGRTGGPAPA